MKQETPEPPESPDREQLIEIELTVNGETVQVEVDPRRSLLFMLRDQLDLTGTRYGCLTGHCGACTVKLDGEVVKSCLVLAASVDGREFETIESVSGDEEEDLHPVQRAFWEELGFQCGYCTPGMIMSVLELLEENPSPSNEEIREGISGNLCRCTGYENIVASVQSAAEEMES